jgi:hypothetical protein
MKSKMGVAKWCSLYRVEMEEADMIVKLPRKCAKLYRSAESRCASEADVEAAE